MKNLFTFLLLTLSVAAFAQRQAWNLDTDFNLKPAVDLDRTLAEAGMDYDAACARYPRWCERWRVKAQQAGWTVARDRETFLKNTTFTAAYMQAYFAGQMHDLAFMTSASAHINIPWGEYRYSTQLYQPIGVVSGSGTFAGGLAMGSTVISPAHEKWNPEPGSDPLIRTAFTTAKCGVAGNAGYAESMTLQNLRLEGRKAWRSNGDLMHFSYWQDPSYSSHGIDACGPGESYRLINIQSNNWNGCGVRSDGATPMYADHITVFKNAVAGFQLAGSALGTGYIGLISGDENPYLVDLVEGDKGDRGGQWFIAAIKSEGGTNIPADMKHPWVGQMPVRIQGQAGVEIGVISAATTHYRIHAAILVDNRIVSHNRAPQNMAFTIGKIKTVGSYEYLIADVATGTMYKSSGNYVPGELNYIKNDISAPEVTFNRKPIAAEPYPLQDRLGYATGSTTFNLVAGTPAFSYTKPGGTVVEPPKPCTYTTTTWSAWSACKDGKQSRTRTVTSTPQGCVGTPPNTTDERSCTIVVDPEPTGLPLDPKDVIVVINSADPKSRAIADHYRKVWGTTREVVLNLGGSQSITKATMDKERAKIGDAKALALCFTVPTRVDENNSITSAITYGYTTPNSTKAATGYGKPSAAIKRAVLVYSTEVIDKARAATGTRPKGTIYTVLANDGGGTAPRGDARAPQVTGSAGDRIKAKLPAGVSFVVQDNRKGCAGECGGNELLNKPDVLAYFGSMYKMSGWHTNTVLAGAYADNLTSTSGNLPTGQGQTPITTFLPSNTSGTVAEPWQSNSTTTARQFMRVDTFSVAYFGQGASFAQAAYRAVERPWRLLVVGDPLGAPYANVQPIDPVDPVYPPPTGGVLGSWSFSSGDPANIAGTGAPLVLASGTATIDGGALRNSTSYTYWTTAVAGVKEVKVEGFTPSTFSYQYIVTNAQGRGLIMLPDGSVVDNTAGDRPVLPAGTLRKDVPWTGAMTLPAPMDVRHFGAAPGQGNAWQGSIMKLELR